MGDVRAPLRVLDELLWSIRRSGFAIATGELKRAEATRATALARL